MTGPPKPMRKNKRVVAYVTTLQKINWQKEARKRNTDISNLIKIAVHEFLYRPKVSRAEDVIIRREDREPKGALNSVHQVNYKEVVKEFKRGIELAPVPENEIKHIYNIMIEERS